MAFHIGGSPNVNINVLTAGFTVSNSGTPYIPGAFNASPFGSFEYALKCTGCGSGYAGGLSGPLQLTVTPITGVLTTASFMPSGLAHFFAVDIVDTLGNSGNVVDPGDPVPEPATEILLGSALLILGTAIRLLRPSHN